MIQKDRVRSAYLRCKLDRVCCNVHLDDGCLLSLICRDGRLGKLVFQVPKTRPTMHHHLRGKALVAKMGWKKRLSQGLSDFWQRFVEQETEFST
jgi:hypothetical protein